MSEDAALLRLEQLGQLGRVDPRHRDVRPDPVDDQRAQQEPAAAASDRRTCDPALQCRLLVANVRSCARSRCAALTRRCRRRLRSPPWRPWSPARRSSFTARSILPALITLAAARVRHDPSRLQHRQIDLVTGNSAESDRRTSARQPAAERHEAALRQAALQRHLAAFEADLVEAARARFLALVAAAGGLAESRCRCRGRRARRALAPRRRFHVLSRILVLAASAGSRPC